MFTWLRRLFRQQAPTQPTSWFMYGLIEGENLVFLGRYEGSEEAAWDACGEAWMDWLESQGRIQNGTVVGKSGITPVCHLWVRSKCAPSPEELA